MQDFIHTVLIFVGTFVLIKTFLLNFTIFTIKLSNYRRYYEEKKHLRYNLGVLVNIVRRRIKISKNHD